MVLLSYVGSVESMICTAVHLRSRSLNIVSLLDMIEGSYRSWDLYTTSQLVDGLQQKKKKKEKPVFIKRKWNHVVFSTFLFQQHIYIYIYIYPISSRQVGCDTRLILMRSLRSLNSEFSFFEIGCHTKVKVHILPYNLVVAWEGIVWFMSFLYIQPRSGFQVGSPC